MSERIKVRPREGLTVRHPVTREPLEAGTELDATREVLRLVLSGDLVREDAEHGVEQMRAGDREEA